MTVPHWNPSPRPNPKSESQKLDDASTSRLSRIDTLWSLVRQAHPEVAHTGATDSVVAARRELIEETGYRGEEPRSLGSVSSNPAILTNRTYTYWIPNAELAGEPEPDEHEALTVETHPADAILPLVEEGRIHHALSVVALLRYLSASDT